MRSRIKHHIPQCCEHEGTSILLDSNGCLEPRKGPPKLASLNGQRLVRFRPGWSLYWYGNYAMAGCLSTFSGILAFSFL
ncbi:hypothetical protein V8C35DRAFT_282799 [Trichoderma chlorosporum]